MLLFIVLIFIEIAFGALLDPLKQHPVDLSYDTFKLWMKEYHVKYRSKGEESDRYVIWEQNVKRINEHNDGGNSWSQGVNKFTGLTDEEFSDYYLMAPQDCSATEHNGRPQPELDQNHYLVGADPPASIDWRDKKIISEVKNQGNCGSCWSFSTTGCLEAHSAQYTGQLVLYSEQQLVDCAGHFKNHGCNGGLPSQAFEYVYYTGGIDSEFYYPYVSGKTGRANNHCDFSSGANNEAGKVYGIYNVTQYNETDIFYKVGTIGPVSICFEVISGFHSYTGGVYSSSKCKNTSSDVNHAVLAVGYGTQKNPDKSETPFWIVKNSWGWSWGLQGYFLIERGVNMCGLASCASFPIMDPSMLSYL